MAKEQIANGERVATRKTFYGTHQGAFDGIDPAYRELCLPVIDIVRVADGKIREHWNVVDVTEFLTQLQS